MSAQGTSFRWRSQLGASVIIFLVYGMLNVLAALYVPITLHTGGPWSVPGIIFTEDADRAMLGEELARLTDANSRLWSFEVAFMDTMCAFMMAYALLHLAVAWFALRRGQTWSLWVLLAAGLAPLPYYVAAAGIYVGYGVPLQDTLPFLLFSSLPIGIGAALGAKGLARFRRSSQTLNAA